MCVYVYVCVRVCATKLCNPFVYLINFIASAIIAVKCYFASASTRIPLTARGTNRCDHDH